MTETNEMYIRDPDVHNVDVYHILRIPSSLRGSIGTCATSKDILIVTPTRDYTDVTTHVNPRHIKCKPWGKLIKEK